MRIAWRLLGGGADEVAHGAHVARRERSGEVGPAGVASELALEHDERVLERGRLVETRVDQRRPDCAGDGGRGAAVHHVQEAVGERGEATTHRALGSGPASAIAHTSRREPEGAAQSAWGQVLSDVICRSALRTARGATLRAGERVSLPPRTLPGALTTCGESTRGRVRRT